MDLKHSARPERQTGRADGARPNISHGHRRSTSTRTPSLVDGGSSTRCTRKAMASRHSSRPGATTAVPKRRWATHAEQQSSHPCHLAHALASSWCDRELARHSAGAASGRAALLVGRIRPVFSHLTPGRAGASPPSMRRANARSHHERSMPPCTPMCRCADVPMCRCADVPMCRSSTRPSDAQIRLLIVPMPNPIAR